MDDFVVNVKQIGNYPATTTVGAADVLLLQQGGLGGDYMSILAANLVSTALSSGGTMKFAPGGGPVWNGASLTWKAGSGSSTGPGTFTFSDAISAPGLDATTLTVAGVSVATTDALTAATANLVTSVNGRTGAVQLQTSDILQAGAAPIWDAHFGGDITAPTVWDFRQNDDTVATTAFVQLVLNQLLCGGSVVTSFNGRGGAVVLSTADVNAAYANFPNDLIAPTAPNPASGDASNRIATTLFVDDGLADLQSLLPSLIDQELTTANFAPINSPNFTGVPTAPTAAAGSQTGQLATTAFVHNAVVAATTGVASFNTRTGAITLTTADITNAGGAPIASPAFTGTPTAPTAVLHNSSTDIATTAYVQGELAALPAAGVTSFNTRTGSVVLSTADVTAAGGAPLASPGLTGVPTAPTAAQADSSTTLATTAFVHAAVSALGTTVQSFNGRTGVISLIGNDISAAGGALLAGPVFTGSPTAPTATVGTNTTQLATTAFVQSALAAVAAGVSSFNTRTGAITLITADVTGAGGAPIASPNFSGVPTAPTPVTTSNDTTIATTSFVKAAIAAGSGVTSFNSRTGVVTLQANDISAAGGALLAGPNFTGVPTAPTASPGVSTTQLATTAFVAAALSTAGGVQSFNGRAGVVTLSLADVTGAGGAPIASPTFTGTATASLFSGPTTGVTNGGNAAAGQVGEYRSATLASGSAINLTSVQATNITTLSLPAGDWDIDGVVDFSTSGGAIITNVQCWVATTSALSPPAPSGGMFYMLLVASGGLSSGYVPTGRMRFSLAATTTVYLSGLASFTTGAVTAFGFIQARRMR